MRPPAPSRERCRIFDLRSRSELEQGHLRTTCGAGRAVVRGSCSFTLPEKFDTKTGELAIYASDGRGKTSPVLVADYNGCVGDAQQPIDGWYYSVIQQQPGITLCYSTCGAFSDAGAVVWYSSGCP